MDSSAMSVPGSPVLPEDHLTDDEFLAAHPLARLGLECLAEGVKKAVAVDQKRPAAIEAVTV